MKWAVPRILVSWLLLGAGACGDGARPAILSANPSAFVRFGGPGYQRASAVTSTAAGAVMVGAFEGSLIAGDKVVVGQGGLDAFVLATGDDGQVQYLRSLAGPGDDFLNAIVQTSDGAVVAGGQCAPGSDFCAIDPEVDPDLLAAAHLTKLDGRGESVWALTTRGSGFQSITALAPAADGASYVAGSWSGTLVWEDQTLVATGESDAFVAKVDAAGRLHWLTVIGGDRSQHFSDLLVLSDGGLIAGGTYTGDLLWKELTFSRNALLDRTPFLVRFDDQGRSRWVQTRLVPQDETFHGVLLAHDEEGAANETRHAACVFDRITAVETTNHDIAVTVSYGSVPSHAVGFESPEIGTVLTARLNSGGAIVKSQYLESATAQVQIAAAYRGADPGRPYGSVFASWIGDFVFPAGVASSPRKRSLVFFDLDEESRVGEVRRYDVVDAALTAENLAPGPRGTIAVGRWFDLASRDSDVFFSIFPE